MKDLLNIANSPIVKDGQFKVGIDSGTIVTLAVAILIVAVIIILMLYLLKHRNS
jgi:hypothetical protein